MKKNEDAASKRKPKTSAAQIRVQKGKSAGLFLQSNKLSYRNVDLTELDLPSTMKTEFPDVADLLNFTLTITPDEGTQLRLFSARFLHLPSCRHVQGWRVCIFFRNKHQLPTRPPEGQVHPNRASR